MIKVKDIVYHSLSGLYYRCENAKMEKWMNMNNFYRKATEEEVKGLPELYFVKYK